MTDREFMARLFELHAPAMLEQARRDLTDGSGAEDLVQDCMVKLLRRVATLRGLDGPNLERYLSRTVRNTALNRNRDAENERRRLEFTGLLPPTGCGTVPGPEEALLAQAYRAELRALLSGLDEADRAVLSDRYRLGLTDEAIAARLHCKPASVRMKLTRARRSVRAKMRIYDLL